VICRARRRHNLAPDLLFGSGQPATGDAQPGRGCHGDGAAAARRGGRAAPQASSRRPVRHRRPPSGSATGPSACLGSPAVRMVSGRWYAMSCGQLTAPIAGKRSTATAGELHGERDDGEEMHLELLAWLGLVTRSVRAAWPAGFAASIPRLVAGIRPACRGFPESAIGRHANASLS
jgi:hypothetical protein